MKKFLYLKYILFSVTILQADIIVTGAYTDTETNDSHGWHTRLGGSVVDDRNPVHGYINKYTSITITVTLTDAPNSNNHGDRNTWMKVFLGFATERNVPANFITEDIDQCQEVNSDTIQLTLNIDLPENKAPEITNLDTYKLIVNNEFKIDINAIEPDNQLVFLDLISTSPKGNFSFLYNEM